ncbi:MAG: YbhB/YbcL family Raf kinase inhibitor-like protein [Elusimicrobia bacterium]|nr:YbhB/YbcL family Raf kinase inhibitor-like protein [Elusimicrobiota bacterium]
MQTRLTLALLLAAASARGAGLELTSPAFKGGEAVPPRFTCSGKDVSPALEWSGAPEKTAAFVLTLDDPDAPPGVWVHWVVLDLPAAEKGLAEGIKAKKLPPGAGFGASWGVDTFSRAEYSGPCPPPGAPHRYVFTLYALDAKLGLPAKKTTKALALKAMDGHVLAKSELIGTFKR